MSSIAEQPNSSSNAGYAAVTGGAVGSVSDSGKDAQRWNFDRDDVRFWILEKKMIFFSRKYQN